MAITVSVRFEGGKNLRGQALHDFSKRPSYADKEREKFNHLVDLSNGLTDATKIESFIRQQQADLIERYQSKSGRGRKWRTDSKTHLIGLISFGGGFHSIQNAVDKEALDQKAKAYIFEFCTENRCRPGYLMRHEDESTTHYHFMVTNVNEQTWKPLRLQRNDLSNQQTKIAETFSPMLLPFGKSFGRGKRKGEHFQEALKAHPQRLGEPVKDWHRRVWQETNTIHKSVNRLHEDLPREIAALDSKRKAMLDEIASFRAAKQEAEKASEQAQKRAFDALQKLERAQADETTTQANIDKLTKRVAAYEQRASARAKELDRLNGEFFKAKDEIGVLDAEIERKNSVLQKMLSEVEQLSFKASSAEKRFNEVNEKLTVSEEEAAKIEGFDFQPQTMKIKYVSGWNAPEKGFLDNFGLAKPKVKTPILKDGVVVKKSEIKPILDLAIKAQAHYKKIVPDAEKQALELLQAANADADRKIREAKKKADQIIFEAQERAQEADMISFRFFMQLRPYALFIDMHAMTSQRSYFELIQAIENSKPDEWNVYNVGGLDVKYFFDREMAIAESDSPEMSAQVLYAMLKQDGLHHKHLVFEGKTETLHEVLKLAKAEKLELNLSLSDTQQAELAALDTKSKSQPALTPVPVPSREPNNQNRPKLKR